MSTVVSEEYLTRVMKDAAPYVDKAIKFIVGSLIVEGAKRAYRAYNATAPVVAAATQAAATQAAAA